MLTSLGRESAVIVGFDMYVLSVRYFHSATRYLFAECALCLSDPIVTEFS